jgi:L-fuconolactonase
MRIDAHQHFWRYTPAEYPWIDARMGVLARDWLPGDLAPELSRVSIGGCIAVQARADPAENDFLLGLAREHAFVRGVVGWVDLCAEGVEAELARLARDPLFVGVRHLVQDEPDDQFVLRPDFQRGLAALAGLGLTYDLLTHPRHLPAAIALVERFPEQRFVLDHLSKPDVESGTLDPWRAELRLLAESPHVACKLSGLVTQADWRAWRPADCRPYLDHAYAVFGEERVMFGSDWPVCLLAADYARVHALIDEWAAALSDSARAKLFGENAARFYGITHA